MSKKITMIGLTNAGKTCYLIATAARMLDGISGFEFVPTSSDQGLELENMWDSLCDDRACWFAGSQNTTQEYVFKCFCNGRTLAPGTSDDSKDDEFTWVDYRGGLWKEFGGDNPETEVGKLYERCTGSDALIVAIPGDVLVKCVQNPNDKTVLRMFHRYQSVLQTMRAKHTDEFRQMAIVLTITKSDCIDPKTEMATCLCKVKEKFAFCFDQYQRACMITAVSLGNFGASAAQGQAIEGEIDPINLHLPILLPFYLWIREKEQAAREHCQDYKSYARDEEKRSWLGKLFFGNDSEYYHGKADEYGALAGELLDAAKNIEYEFNNSVILYEHGKRTIGIKGVEI